MSVENVHPSADREPDPTPAVVALGALFGAHRVLAESMDRAVRAASGLSKAQAEVLVVLDGAPGQRLRMSDVARAVGVTRSGATQIVDLLTAAGHVERAGDEHDRRSVRVGITDAGRDVVRRTRPVFAAQAEEHLAARLTQQQVEALRDALQVLTDQDGPGPGTDAVARAARRQQRGPRTA